MLLKLVKCAGNFVMGCIPVVIHPYDRGSTNAGHERTKAAGRCVTAGYTIAGKIQPVIRFGYLNTDKTTTGGDNTSYALYSTFGVATI